MNHKSKLRLAALEEINWVHHPLTTDDSVWDEWKQFLITAYKNTSILGIWQMVAPVIAVDTISKDMTKLGIKKRPRGPSGGGKKSRKRYVSVNRIKYHIHDFCKEFNVPFGLATYRMYVKRPRQTADQLLAELALL